MNNQKIERLKNNLYDNNVLKKGRFDKKSRTTIPLIKVLCLLCFLCKVVNASLIFFIMFSTLNNKYRTTSNKNN